MLFRVLYSLFLPAAIALNFIAHHHEHLGHLLESHEDVPAINFISHHTDHYKHDHHDSEIEIDAYCDLCQSCDDQGEQKTTSPITFDYIDIPLDVAQSDFKLIWKNHFPIRAPPKVTLS